MIPVYLNEANGLEGLKFEQFKSKFLRICKTHHDENRALAFAFIICNFTNAEVIKVLDDCDYWSALDQLSGKRLTVFSFHVGGKKTATMTFMSPVHSNSFEEPQHFLEKHFGLELSDSKPALLFFQVSNLKIIDSFSIALESDTVEETFNEIRHLLRQAVESIHQVKDEYRENRAEIFNLIKDRIGEEKNIRKIKKVLSVTEFVHGLFSKFTGG